MSFSLRHKYRKRSTPHDHDLRFQMGSRGWASSTCMAQGQVRDLRARWALEEAGLPYKTRLLALGDQDKPDYRAAALRAGADA
jgi:hypothetical protein